jgi:hypothetical protein
MKKLGFISVLWAAVLLLGLMGGCSDSTEPTTPAGGGDLGETMLEGSFDPGAGTFVLKTLDLPTPDGPPVRVQLVGSEMTTDPDLETVEIMVAVRSLHDQPLHPPALVWIARLQPAEVTVLNADVLRPINDPDGNPTDLQAFGFDYSDLLGDDGVLSPEETSGAKLWRFSSPGLQSFSFGARFEVGLAPDLPRLGGLCFHDENRDGVPQPDENPLGHGVVHIVTPGGETVEVLVRPEGRYGMHLTEAGLYTVHYDPMIDTFAPISFSTPNPRQVMILAGEDGELQSFLQANFGVFTDVPLGPPPVQFTDLPADSLHYEMWSLEDVELEHHVILELEVGFSGCQPHHPFTLWASGGFMESDPVQMNLVLTHDLAEDCDAAFETDLAFSLWPLRERFLEAYGPGVLQLNLIDFEGEVHEIEWGIFPPD